jgi:predicted  nucleic acid-binding Zn-ribbon protein
MDVESVIDSLREANEIAKTAIQSNNDFNLQLTGSLGSISDQIRQIDTKIRELTGKLSQLQDQVQTNEATIAAKEKERIILDEKIKDLDNARAGTDSELLSIASEKISLEMDYQKLKREHEKELSLLNDRLNEEKQQLINATTEEKKILNDDISRINDDINKLGSEYEKDKRKYETDLANLNKEKDDLQQQLENYKVQTTNLETSANNLELSSSQLISENTNLKSTLENAKEQMNQAIENLTALSNNPNRGDIDKLISTINQQLASINEFLEIPVNNQGPNISLNQGPNISLNQGPNLPLNTKINYTFSKGWMMGSENKTFTLGQVLDAVRVDDFKNTKQKTQQEAYDDFINELYKAVDVDQIISFFNKCDKNLIGKILSRKSVGGIPREGGRKTRKVVRRKTRRGGKTRKIRKQKGGYHYRERAKRRSITTTSRRSSSRRSKRSSTRRTSPL